MFSLSWKSINIIGQGTASNLSKCGVNRNVIFQFLVLWLHDRCSVVVLPSASIDLCMLTIYCSGIPEFFYDDVEKYTIKPS